MQNPIPRSRWLVAFITGTLAWFLALVIAGLLSSGLSSDNAHLRGLQLALRGLTQLLLATVGIALAIRLVKAHLSDLGLVKQHLRADVLIGIAVGILLPVLQFGVIIPNTGGAARSDVVASRAIIGDNWGGLVGAVILGWTAGGVAEELFFRGHIFFTLRGSLGDNRLGLGVALLISVMLFAVLHAYQGLIGVLDTGLFALIMALLYLWRRRLTASIVAHGLNDMVLFIGLYLWY